MKKIVNGPSEEKKKEESERLLQKEPWIWWREKMPVTQHWAYFDHAAVSPLSGPAAAAVQQFAVESRDSGDMNWLQWAATAEKLRGQCAELLQADPGEICLVPNTTSGINLVAEGFPWAPGDSVVIPEGEFPSNLFPWKNQAQKGVELRIVPRRDGQVRVDDLLERVDLTTRIISVSWVGYASGFRIDLNQPVQRAHERGVLVFLDAIQGLGIFPLDLRETPVDFLAADGHKWLLGPEGIGVSMVRKQHLNQLRCGGVGWNSVKNAFNYAEPKMELRDAASRFEGGSLNLMGIAALSASIELFLRIRSIHGQDAIEQRILHLADVLEHRLEELGVSTRLSARPEHRSGIVTFEVPGIDPAEFRRFALKQQVVLSCRDGGVRASIHAYNNEVDLDRLVRLVEQHLT